jgi:ABC-type Fe3+ transport system substrate-binding protein
MRFFLKKVGIIILLSHIINMSCTVLAQARTMQTIRVMTPLSGATTMTFKHAFENKYPYITVEIIKKKTDSGLKFIEENRHANTIDIFWASSPDAFKILKDKRLLLQYLNKKSGIPKKLGLLPINDPANYYKGFAVSGYGIMESDYYMNSVGLPLAREWQDLKNPIYKDHVAMSSASRSGTTHLIVEILLQSEGWQQGWLSWKEIAGNFKIIPARSVDVPNGVIKGRFGIGLVIDYYALSYKALGFPVNFTYPSQTALLPANIAIIDNAPNKEAAKLFIDFILSDTGQKILLKEKISRLPVKPSAYIDTDRTFPNPFVDKALASKVQFDINLSKSRYAVVNSLFDVMITYNLESLKTAVAAINTAEKVIKKNANIGENTAAQNLLKQARQLLAWTPVDVTKAQDIRFNAIFTKSRKKASTKITGKQAEIEQIWDKQIKKNYAEATTLAEKALWAQ